MAKKQKHVNINLHTEPIKILKGFPGDKGEQGAAGESGSEGKQGLQGEKGSKGYNGINGKNGEAGISGKDGLDYDSNVLSSVTLQVNQNTRHRDDPDKHFDTAKQKEHVLDRVNKLEGTTTFLGGSSHSHNNHNKLANYSHTELADLDSDDHLQYLLLEGRDGQTITDNVVVTGSLKVDNVVFPKVSANGIKIDIDTPTFGFADLLGDQFSKNTGASKPTLITYNGAVEAWQFGNGDEAFLTYHIPHDYVIGTDIHLHIHWSQNAAGATGGTVDFKYTAIYAKGHNQTSGSAFTSTPKTDTFSSIDINDSGSGLVRYQQHFTEVIISAATATSALFDRDDFEPDGVLELTFELVTSNLTGTPSTPFVHYVDIHYMTTGIIGTKSRTPDFYT